MKKILLLTLCASALGLAGSAMAQAAGPVGGPPQTTGGQHAKIDRKERAKMNEEILAKLNLTPDQRAKIKAHEDVMKAKLLELRKSEKGAKGAGKPEDLKEKIKALRKENQEFMKQTLTKEQMKELKQLRRAEMKDLMSKPGAGTPKP